jgi:hypothetical protein
MSPALLGGGWTAATGKPPPASVQAPAGRRPLLETSPIEETAPTAWEVMCRGAAQDIRIHVLLRPGVCLMSEVYSAMNNSCRCWQADQDGVVQNKAVTRGLWSVRRRKRHPSNRKWRIALKATSSSLLKVEYQLPTPDSFFEKKASGCQLSLAHCCRTLSLYTNEH